MIDKGLRIPKYSLGTGDRFAHQANAQLQACVNALEAGIEVIPVWNKSNREHTIIGSEPASTRAAADAAVSRLGWRLPYFVDADHISEKTVDRFLATSDFYTIDVADFIGKSPAQSDVDMFVRSHSSLVGEIFLPGIDEAFCISEENLRGTTTKFLAAVKEAGVVYRKIRSVKGAGNFVIEISIDETDCAQTPAELLIILAAVAAEKIPIQTIAPKFSGRFNKGVDYAGNVAQFERELTLDVAAIAYAIEHFGVPGNLKLSVHSGSDKFSVFPAIHRAITRFGAGVHLKTAGTTWLEEIIGLAEAGGDGLALAKEIYAEAVAHREELCAPYSTVIDIDATKLPCPDAVQRWSSEEFTSALRHDPDVAAYNPSLRQLLHVGFKVAAKMGGRYLNLLDAHQAVIERNVTENLWQRHILPVFLGLIGRQVTTLHPIF